MLVKIGDFITFKGFLVKFLDNPRNSPEKWIFLSLAFAMHLVSTLLRTQRESLQAGYPADVPGSKTSGRPSPKLHRVTANCYIAVIIFPELIPALHCLYSKKSRLKVILL